MLYKIIRRIINHPLNESNKVQAIYRFIKWQLLSRILRRSMIFNFAQKSKLILKSGSSVATGNYYCGLFEFEEMAFVLHYLKPGDLFVDVGANIGSFTLLAASELEVDTISIEPIPSTFGELKENIKINGIEEKVKALNIGLGANSDMLRFTNSQSAINHVAVEGEENTIDVEVKTFDNVIPLNSSTLVKIDVEGFETEVLKGMEKSLKDSRIKAILIETNNSGHRYGMSDNDIHNYLIASNFQPYFYDPWNRKFLLHDMMIPNKSNNTVYIRSLTESLERVRQSPLITINGVSF